MILWTSLYHFTFCNSAHSVGFLPDHFLPYHPPSSSPLPKLQHIENALSWVVGMLISVLYPVALVPHPIHQ
jgi:hypothetical protein